MISFVDFPQVMDFPTGKKSQVLSPKMSSSFNPSLHRSINQGNLRFSILVFQVECNHQPYPKLRPLLRFCKSRRSLSLTIIVWISAWGMFLATQSLFVSLHQKPFIVLTRGSWALLCSDSGSATRSSCDWQKYTELQAQHSKIKSLDPPH